MTAATDYLGRLIVGGDPGGGPTSLTDLTDVTGEPGLGKAPVDDGAGVFPLTEVTTREDLDAVLADVARVERHPIGASGEPGFLSGFRNIGDPWAAASYRHLSNGTVRLEGTVMCQDDTIGDATWIPVFQLPSDLAPGSNLEFSALTNDNAISRMYVWDDGLVVWGGYAIGDHGPVGRLPLNQISFSASG